MSNTEIENIIKETLKAQKKQSLGLQGWIKFVVMVVFVPIMTVYSSFRVIEWRVEQIECNLEKINCTYVSQSWYERYIIGQKELIDRLEQSVKDGDSALEAQIDEVKEYLNRLVKEKKLYYRDKT